METLEEFYGDPRRQESKEVRFGSGWHSSKFEHFEFVVFWVAETEELCLLGALNRDVRSDGVFSRFILGVPPHVNPQPLGDGVVTIEVLATLSEERLDTALEGWQEQMKDPAGVEWLRRALATATR
ncbi:MAG: hypothetical protein ACRD1T_08365 [Acidimicrobiia bacterium]